jgi:hypothetical protein
LSLRELWREFAAHRQRIEQKRQWQIVLAWEIERIRILTANAKGKMPDLKTLLEETATTHDDRPTPAQMTAQVALLSQYLGIPLRKAKRKKGRKGSAHG